MCAQSSLMRHTGLLIYIYIYILEQDIVDCESVGSAPPVLIDCNTGTSDVANDEHERGLCGEATEKHVASVLCHRKVDQARRSGADTTGGAWWQHGWYFGELRWIYLWVSLMQLITGTGSLAKLAGRLQRLLVVLIDRTIRWMIAAEPLQMMHMHMIIGTGRLTKPAVE